MKHCELNCKSVDWWRNQKQKIHYWICSALESVSVRQPVRLFWHLFPNILRVTVQRLAKRSAPQIITGKICVCIKWRRSSNYTGCYVVIILNLSYRKQKLLPLKFDYRVLMNQKNMHENVCMCVKSEQRTSYHKFDHTPGSLHHTLFTVAKYEHSYHYCDKQKLIAMVSVRTNSREQWITRSVWTIRFGNENQKHYVLTIIVNLSG